MKTGKFSRLRLIVDKIIARSCLNSGAYGLLSIPDVDVRVLLYKRVSGNGQDIVDAPNAAVIFRLGCQTVIADHGYQGFSAINGVIDGKTEAYIYYDHNQAAEKYVCDGTEVGHVKVHDDQRRLYDANWVMLHEAPQRDLCMYTCLGPEKNGVTDVRLTYWRKII